MKAIEVVAAIIKHEDHILCVQRPKSKLSYVSEKFEFPGGKIELNESRKEALKRELREELNLNVPIEDFYLTVEHQYPDFHLTMHAFLVNVDSKEIELNEHISLEWLNSKNLMSLDWAAADIPIVNKLMQNEI